MSEKKEKPKPKVNLIRYGKGAPKAGDFRLDVGQSRLDITEEELKELIRQVPDVILDDVLEEDIIERGSDAEDDEGDVSKGEDEGGDGSGKENEGD